jgi:hypothetical protein
MMAENGLPEGPGKDIVRLPSCKVYITGHKFKLVILQHCMEYPKDW